ncbi:gliding motility-associated C-terminal domain-containing protein [Croceivirga sp. JEA036]|uniref:T9SS type B sorting domain-containing protein n=1 Tax=Croceivirga sp. JEA036 TaxID=2721162 RepID=UPI001FD86799|nr:gliding motility-associated C-terminal domain-containing protein [Croceivirga sp. JEA036]
MLNDLKTYYTQILPTLMKTKMNQGLGALLLLWLLGLATATGQTLNKPTPAANPNLGSTTPWTSACGSENFNEYYVEFTWGPPLVASTNEFILELSNANGSFANPIELDRVSDKNTEFDFLFSFNLPTDTRGDGYKFRVRSTNPEKTSEVSDAFSMYYIDYNSPILISKDGNGTIPPSGTIDVCTGAQVTLAAHNVPNADNYIYSWYRSGTKLSSTGPSITVSESGLYFVEMDYGANCSGSANTISNSIEVNINAPQGIAINTPTKTTLCSDDTITLQANNTGNGYTYTWYKDGSIVQPAAVEGATLSVSGSTAGFEGDYQVEVEGDGICLERSAAVTIQSAGSFTVSLDNPTNLVLLPSKTETLTVSTDASTPSYQWYKNGTAISGATNATITVSEVGDYHVTVTETGGTCSSVTKTSETTTVVFPQDFAITIDYLNTYEACISTSVELTVASITATDANGNQIDVTDNLKNEFTYQWKKDNTTVIGASGATLSLVNASENGTYSLTATLDTFTVNTIELPVVLNSGENIAISSDGNVLCDGVIITISTDYDLTGKTYEWYLNNTKLDITTASITATEVGNYQLRVITNGCPIISNEVVITAFDESIVQLDTDSNLVFPEGESKVVNASGADSYAWFDETNNNISTSSSITLSEEGTYILLASSGNCQISRTVTVSYRDNFDIPNVVTANGDGANDLWVIPNTYSRQANVTVTIYNENGEEVLNQRDYQNNWPSSSLQFSKKNQLFYYKIQEGNKTLRQGTITVIR